jgi:type II secretion system protein I
MCRSIGSPGGSPSTRSRRGGTFGRKPGSRAAGGDAGFTLIEVLVAFSVLAIVLVPLLQVFGDGLGTTQTAREYARATLLARSRLAEIGVDAPLREGEETGSFDEPGFRWRTEVVRDTSEVIAPRPPAGARERRSSRDAGRASGARGSGVRDGGARESGARDSGFGRGGTGFGGSRSSRFGQTSDRSGDRAPARSSRFGQTSDRSGGVFGSQTEGGAAGEPDDDELLADEPTLLLYRVMVTVEWGKGGAKSLTLSTLRAGRSGDDLDEENARPGSGSSFDRGGGGASGRESGRERSSGFGSRASGSGSGFGSRSGTGSGSR